MAASPQASNDAGLRMMCSHGGLFLPCVSMDGGLGRYVGGETRVLVVPREVSFRDLATKLAKLVSVPGKMKIVVTAVKYRISVDGDDVLVSVTCDEELAHMRDEHDRVKKTRPSAIFRVFFTAVQRRGLPPLAPKMRRVQSEKQAARPSRPAPVRRVQSAHQIAGSSNDRRNQCYCSCMLPQPRPAPSAPVYVAAHAALGVQERTWCAEQEEPPAMSKDTHGIRSPGSEAVMKKSGSEPEAEEVNRSACWELD